MPVNVIAAKYIIAEFLYHKPMEGQVNFDEDWHNVSCLFSTFESLQPAIDKIYNFTEGWERRTAMTGMWGSFFGDVLNEISLNPDKDIQEIMIITIAKIIKGIQNVR